VYEFNYLPTNKRITFILHPWKEHRLSGKVVDERGRPVEGVLVKILSKRYNGEAVDERGRPAGKSYGGWREDTPNGSITSRDGRFAIRYTIQDSVTVLVSPKTPGKYQYTLIPGIRLDLTDTTFVLKDSDSWKPFTGELASDWYAVAGKTSAIETARELEVDRWLYKGPQKVSDRKGKITILYFWTEKEPANIDSEEYELRLTNLINQYYSPQGVMVIGVYQSKGNPGMARDLIQKYGLTFPVALDKASDEPVSLGKTFNLFGVRPPLRFLIIDPEGKVIPVRWAPGLEKALKKLLGNASR
jgi:peroxiredoxin